MLIKEEFLVLREFKWSTKKRPINLKKTFTKNEIDILDQLLNNGCINLLTAESLENKTHRNKYYITLEGLSMLELFMSAYRY